MRLRTRVLSFMLAGSMMLSATPVSAFAEANQKSLIRDFLKNKNDIEVVQEYVDDG